MEDETFEKVKEYVRQQQEKHDEIYAVSLEEISRETGIDEVLILADLAFKANSGELVGTEILIGFND